MGPGYRVGPIKAAQVDAAYVLVSRLIPQLDADRWRACCRDSIGGTPAQRDRAEVAVATNIPGYVRGFAVAAPLEHLSLGRILDVGLFGVISAADERGVAGDLLDYLRRQGRASGCVGLRVWVVGDSGGLESLLDPAAVGSGRGFFIRLDRNAGPASAPAAVTCR